MANQTVPNTCLSHPFGLSLCRNKTSIHNTFVMGARCWYSIFFLSKFSAVFISADGANDCDRCNAFFIELNSDLWTPTKDVHGTGGVPRNIAVLDKCKSFCMDDSQCVAIDWEPNNTGRECWTLTGTWTYPTTEPDHIINYQLNRTVLSKILFLLYTPLVLSFIG